MRPSARKWRGCKILSAVAGIQAVRENPSSVKLSSFEKKDLVGEDKRNALGPTQYMAQR